MSEELLGVVDLKAGSATEAASHVSRIQREVAYLQRIVEDFLAFAREQPLARAPMEAPALLSGACELLTEEAETKGHREETTNECDFRRASRSHRAAALSIDTAVVLDLQEPADRDARPGRADEQADGNQDHRRQGEAERVHVAFAKRRAVALDDG